MGQRHPSTPTQRAQGVAQMIAHSGEYGVVTGLSRQLGVSRQTLYSWCDQGLRALEQVFTPASLAVNPPPALERAILTLLVAGHASYRGIQACLRVLQPQPVRLATIAAVIQAAERRAVAWLSSHAPASARPVALDEIFGNDRHGG
jgi:transposase-like protein